MRYHKVTITSASLGDTPYAILIINRCGDVMPFAWIIYNIKVKEQNICGEFYPDRVF